MSNPDPSCGDPVGNYFLFLNIAVAYSTRRNFLFLLLPTQVPASAPPPVPLTLQGTWVPVDRAQTVVAMRGFLVLAFFLGISLVV